jgi:hypothetical protein
MITFTLDNRAAEAMMATLNANIPNASFVQELNVQYTEQTVVDVIVPPESVVEIEPVVEAEPVAEAEPETLASAETPAPPEDAPEGLITPEQE